MRFSITAKMNPAIRKAIAAIPDDTWTPIPYFLDGADVAETSYRPFGKKRRCCASSCDASVPPPDPNSPCSSTTPTTP